MSATLISDKLKAALLQSAIQGKLTQQLPEDGDARDLLKQIAAEKEQLINEKVIKKEKPLPEIAEDEIPFDIPDNWVWVRLGDVTNYGIGKQIAKHNIDKNALIIELEDISKNSYKLLQKQYDRNPGSSKNYFNRNDVLYGKLRPYLKKCIVADCDGYCSTEIIPIKGYGAINPRFIMYDMTSPFMDNTINNLTYGMDMPRLGTKDAINLIMPLPPLTEQHRIVEAIEIALAKIDKLKVDETKLYNIQKVFPNKLRASLLQSAIQGKLTQQFPEDGDARDLLKQIEIEKARLINDKVIKKEKPLPEITEDEIPFDIPDNWVWVRLGNVSIINPRNKVDDDLETAFIPMTYIKDGYRNEFIYDNKKWKAIKKGFTHFADNDLIIAKITPCFQNRKSAVLQNLPNGFGAGTTELHVVRGINNLIDPLYLLFLSKSNKFINDGIANFTGTAGQQRIGTDFISNYLFPLPPLTEQQRIVETLETALAKIDKLNKLTE